MNKEELKTLKKKVEYCLQNYPETRNSDVGLTIKIWQEFYGVRDSILLYDLYRLPREDAVKRIRAKFQNDLHLYLPTEWEIARQRKINYDVWRKVLGYYTEPKEQLRFI